MGFSFFSVVAWLALATALGVAAWLLRRSAPGAARVVLRLPLEPRRSVYVLDVAGRHLVVGSSEGGIQLLTELDADAVARLSLEAAPATPPLLRALRGAP